MNKLFTKIAALALGAVMAVGVGVAVASSNKAQAVQAADTLVYTLDGTDNTQGSNGYATVSDVTQSGISWAVTANTTINPWRFGGKNLSGVNRTAESTKAVSSENISKVEVVTGSATATVNSISLLIGTSKGNDDIGSQTKTSGLTGQTLTFTRPNNEDWTGRFFTIVFNVNCGGSNQYVQMSSALFYKASGGGDTPQDPVSVTGISLDKESESVYVGKTKTLTATITPSDATNKNVSWESGDDSIAEVNEGVVTGVAVGTTTITAKTEDGNFEASCSITVKAAPTLNYGTLESPVTVDALSEILEYQGNQVLTPQKVFVTGVVSSSTVPNSNRRNVWLYNEAKTNANAFELYSVYIDSSITDISSDADALKGYTVTATGWACLYNETYEITNKDKDGDYDNGYILVATAPTITSVVASVKSGTYYAGNPLSSSDFEVTVNYDNIDSVSNPTGFTWTVNGTANGLLQEGSNSVIVTYNNVPSDSFNVTGTVIHAESITMDATANVYVGKTVTLSPTILPDGAVETVTWSSDDENVATVEDGVVTGVASGTATITARLTQQLAAECEVTVSLEPTYNDLFTIKSGDVVSGTSYQTHTADVDVEIDEVAVSTSWVVTFGGYNNSVGTNSSNRSSCTLGSTYEKYAAGIAGVTSSSTAAAFVSTTKIDYDIAKVKYTIGGGSNQTYSKVYLISSSDGNTFSAVSLASGSAEQGHTLATGDTFINATAAKGYYGLLFVSTNTSGNWRIDDVRMTFVTVDVPRVLDGITLSEGTVKKEYVDGDDVAFDGLVATASYDDGDYEKDVTNHCTITANKAKVAKGDTKITYSAVYDDDNTVIISDLEVTITVVDIAITNFYKTNTYDFKTAFNEFDLFTLGNAIVKAEYNNGSSETITLESEGLTVTLGGSDISGRNYYMETTDSNAEVVLSYKGLSISYNIGTVSAKEAAEGTYVLVTDVTDLAAGDVIRLGSAANDVAAAAMGSGKFFTAVDASFSNGVMTSQSAIDITLGGSTGAWTLTTSEGLVGATAAKSLALSGTRTTTWTITIDGEGSASITSTNSGYGTIRYNSSSPRFLNYASGQEGIEIYKFVEGADADTAGLVNFLKTALYLDSADADYININDHSDGTNCVAYLDTFIEMFNDDNRLSNAQRKIFAEITASGEFIVARGKERVVAWAEHQLKTVSFAETTYKISLSNSQQRAISVFNNNETNTIAVIVVISLISMTAVGGYFFIKRRKEN